MQLFFPIFLVLHTCEILFHISNSKILMKRINIVQWSLYFIDVCYIKYGNVSIHLFYMIAHMNLIKFYCLLLHI